jgi:hypothetical protein
MNYSVETGLLRVWFADFPIPNDPVLNRLFPCRKAFFNKEGKWIGVVCSLEEWNYYVDCMQAAMMAVDGGGGAVALFQMFHDQLTEFLAVTGYTPGPKLQA